MFKKSWLAAAVLSAAVLSGACTTTGIGSGTTRDRSVAVNFAWSSDNARSGTMTATLAMTGQEFAGRFFQVTSATRVDELEPLWSGWGRPRREWRYWGPDFGSDFITHYSGRVLANLTSSNGEYMRCNFRLARPESGMTGGGLGRCQLPDGQSPNDGKSVDGKTIDATFPPAESTRQSSARPAY